VVKLKIMTFNMDRGSNFPYLTTVKNPETFLDNVQKSLVEIMHSSSNLRARQIVFEINRHLPDIVFLTEVAYAKNDTNKPPKTRTVDALQELMRDMEDFGVEYDIILALNGEDILSPSSIPGTGYVLFREREYILYRKYNPDVEVTNPSMGIYKNKLKGHDLVPTQSSRYGMVDIIIKKTNKIKIYWYIFK